jgi:hypothetical protein
MHVGVHGKFLPDSANVLKFGIYGGNLKKTQKTNYIMKVSSEFLQFLHEDGRTEINEGTKRRNFVAFFPNSPKQSHS